MRFTKRKNYIFAAIAAATLAAATFGPISPAQAYGTSEEDLLKACESGIDEVNVSVYCGFESDHVSSSFIEWHRFGAPVTNCSAGTTVDVKQTVGSTRTYTQSWTVGGVAKFSLGPIGIEGKGEMGQSESSSSERRAEITAAPGQKVAATLGKTFNVVEGRLKVIITDNGGGDGTQPASPDTFYIENVQRIAPTDVEEAGVDQVPCGQNFNIDPESTPV